MRLKLALGVLSLCALSACGSTIHSVDGRTTSGALGDGSLGLGPITSTPTAEPDVTGAASSDSSVPSAPDATATDEPVFDGGDSGGTTSSSGALKPLLIGSYSLSGGTAALAAAGFSGIAIPDSKPYVEAFVKDLNAHGGFAGRQVKVVFYEYKSGGDPHAQDAAACATFTQDNHVYLVVGGVNSGAGELLPCLAKHNVPLIGGAVLGDQSFYRQYHRYSYEPTELNFTTGFAELIANLSARGYLKGVHKVGVVQYPGETYTRAIDNGLVPALKKVGLKLDERAATTSTTDNGSIATSSASAQLKFRSAGVDLVLFMSPGGAAETYFMATANTQGYHPKYGIWSADSPYVLAITAPKEQLSGSIGIGYLPGLDVASGSDPTATTPTAKTCLAKGKRMNLDESGLANALLRSVCDVFDLMRKAIGDDVRTTTDTAALESGFDAIGSSFSPASTFAIRLAPGAHDGANGFRDLSYVGDCKCFRYGSVTRLVH